jgi:hypothetical protein
MHRSGSSVPAEPEVIPSDNKEVQGSSRTQHTYGSEERGTFQASQTQGHESELIANLDPGRRIGRGLSQHSTAVQGEKILDAKETLRVPGFENMSSAEGQYSVQKEQPVPARTPSDSNAVIDSNSIVSTGLRDSDNRGFRSSVSEADVSFPGRESHFSAGGQTARPEEVSPERLADFNNAKNRQNVEVTNRNPADLRLNETAKLNLEQVPAGNFRSEHLPAESSSQSRAQSVLISDPEPGRQVLDSRDAIEASQGLFRRGWQPASKYDSVNLQSGNGKSSGIDLESRMNPALEKETDSTTVQDKGIGGNRDRLRVSTDLRSTGNPKSLSPETGIPESADGRQPKGGPASEGSKASVGDRTSNTVESPSGKVPVEALSRVGQTSEALVELDRNPDNGNGASHRLQGPGTPHSKQSSPGGSGLQNEGRAVELDSRDDPSESERGQQAADSGRRDSGESKRVEFTSETAGKSEIKSHNQFPFGHSSLSESSRAEAESSGSVHRFTEKRLPAQEIFTQIVDRFKLEKLDGQFRLNLTLKPEFLGRIQIETALDNEKTVRAIFRVEDSSVRGLIESNLTQIVEKLHESGISVDKAEVADFGSEQGAGSGRQESTKGNSRNQQRQTTSESGRSENPVVEERSHLESDEENFSYFA